VQPSILFRLVHMLRHMIAFTHITRSMPQQPVSSTTHYQWLLITPQIGRELGHELTQRHRLVSVRQSTPTTLPMALTKHITIPWSAGQVPLIAIPPLVECQ